MCCFYFIRSEMKKICYQAFHQYKLQKYQNKLQEDGFQNVPNINKIKFEPYGDFVNQDFSQYNQNLVNNQDPNIQIENDETPGGKISQ